MKRAPIVSVVKYAALVIVLMHLCTVGANSPASPQKTFGAANTPRVDAIKYSQKASQYQAPRAEPKVCAGFMLMPDSGVPIVINTGYNMPRR